MSRRPFVSRTTPPPTGSLTPPPVQARCRAALHRAARQRRRTRLDRHRRRLLRQRSGRVRHRVVQDRVRPRRRAHRRQKGHDRPVARLRLPSERPAARVRMALFLCRRPAEDPHRKSTARRSAPVHRRGRRNPGVRSSRPRRPRASSPATSVEAFRGVLTPPAARRFRLGVGDAGP